MEMFAWVLIPDVELLLVVFVVVEEASVSLTLEDCTGASNNAPGWISGNSSWYGFGSTGMFPSQ